MIFAPDHVQANLRAAYPRRATCSSKAARNSITRRRPAARLFTFEALRPHASKLHVSPAAIRRFAVKPLRALSSASLSGIQTAIKNETTYFEVTTPEHMMGEERLKKKRKKKKLVLSFVCLLVWCSESAEAQHFRKDDLTGRIGSCENSGCRSSQKNILTKANNTPPHPILPTPLSPGSPLPPIRG